MAFVAFPKTFPRDSPKTFFKNAHSFLGYPRVGHGSIFLNPTQSNPINFGPNPIQSIFFSKILTMADHVTAVCRAAYCQLRQLRLITRSLTVDAAKTLVQSFITRHLDYCNALFSGITDTLRRRLQNAEARLVTGTRRRDHITRPIQPMTVDRMGYCFCLVIPKLKRSCDSRWTENFVGREFLLD